MSSFHLLCLRMIIDFQWSSNFCDPKLSYTPLISENCHVLITHLHIQWNSMPWTLTLIPSLTKLPFAIPLISPKRKFFERFSFKCCSKSFSQQSCNFRYKWNWPMQTCNFTMQGRKKHISEMLGRSGEFVLRVQCLNWQFSLHASHSLSICNGESYQN